MASANGFGLTASPNNILFAYDTGDVVNSFKGMPGYNVVGDPYPWIGNNDSTYYKTKTGTTIENIPGMGGPQQVSYVDIYNDYPNSGNCCPSLWRYGDWGVTAGVTGSTLYTYSMIYKCESGYTHPNYMYHYEYNSGGGYLTEYGVFTTAQQIALGNDWYYAWNTFTTQPTCASIYPGCWYYQYGVYDTVYIAGVNIVKGDYKIPPKNFLKAYENRTSTQSIFNLKNQSGVNVNTTSFDGNAQPYFDGTDDDLRVIVSSAKTNVTMEGVVYVNLGTIGTYLSNGDDPGGYCIGIGTYFGTADNRITALFGYIRWILTDSYYQYTGYHHIVMTLDESSTPSIYVNGTLIGTYPGSAPNNVSPGTGFCLGSQWGIRYANTKIPVSKFYDKVLTATEVQANYQNYKTRFNMP
jgi:hypothetical protein